MIRYASFRGSFSYNVESELEEKSKQNIIYVNLGDNSTQNISLYIGCGHI